MSLKYNIHQDPPRKDGQPAAKHLRTVDLKTVDNRALTQAMRRRGNAYSVGSCLGILIDLADTMPELLAKGFAVHLEGIGTFSPQVEGDVEETARGSRATNLHVGAVVFHPDAELLSEVNSRARFEHVLETRRSLPSDAEVEAFLDEHFATHTTLRRYQLESHFRLSKRLALRLLEHLVATHRLLPQGSRHTLHYVRA